MLNISSHDRAYPLRRIGFGVIWASVCLTAPAWADNPIVQTLYTADPAPMVHEGRLYLYTTHDEDVTVNNFFTMNDWRVYSTTDVVNWTDHGSPLHYRDFSWVRGSAWAGQVIYRNNKFYFYVPVVRNNGGNAIGVAVSDSPIGPFEDAIGKPLVTSDCGDIDPTVFIDADNQAYLYWGNPNLCYVELNEDMISYRGGVNKVPMNVASFGQRGDNERPTSYEEGPWLYKRNDLYYMIYPGGPLPEHIAYSTSTSPKGPWVYQDVIMPAEGGSFTNHPGIVDFGGKSLFFYHNGALPGGGGFKRSVAVEEFTYTADGKIPRLKMTKDGAGAVASLNPFERVEAETIAWTGGIETEVCSEGGMNVTDIDDGDYIKLKEVEFGAGATSFVARVAAASGNGAIEVRLDARDGTLVGTCPVAATGGATMWATQTCDLDGAVGKHDVFLMFKGGGFKFNWWQVSGPGEPSNDPGDSGSSDTSGDSTSDASSTSSEPVSATSSADASATSSDATATSSTATPTTATSAPATTTSATSTHGQTTATPTTAPATTSAPTGAPTTDSPDPFVETTGDAASCSCRVGAQRSPWEVAVGVAGLFVWFARRRRVERAARTPPGLH